MTLEIKSGKVSIFQLPGLNRFLEFSGWAILILAIGFTIRCCEMSKEDFARMVGARECVEKQP